MFGQNLRLLRKQHGISQAELADILGIARTTLGDYERGKTEPGFGMLRKIAKYFKISLDSLILNKLEYQKSTHPEQRQLKILSICVDRTDAELIQLVQSKAWAGYIEGFEDPEYVSTLPQIHLPMMPQGSLRAFEIEGDSMYPMESGSIVVCSYVHNIEDIKDGRCYVVVSAGDGIVYKRLKNRPERNSLLLISDNDYYDPYELPYSDLEELWEYRAHIAFDDRISKEDQVLQKLDRINKNLEAINRQLSGKKSSL